MTLDYDSINTIIATTGSIATIIGTIVTIISSKKSLNSKKECEEILKEIKKERNISNSGNVRINAGRSNSGIVLGVNSGDVYNEK